VNSLPLSVLIRVGYAPRVAILKRGAKAIDSDGTVFVHTYQQGYLYALTPSGTLKWSYYVGAANRTLSAPVIGQNGMLYFGVYDAGYNAFGEVHAVRASDGVHQWTHQIGRPVYFPPAIASDGTVYVAGSGENNLRALRGTDGVQLWQWSKGASVSLSGPVVGADGTIYIGSDTGLHALNSSGTDLWSTSVYGKGGVPAIGEDGTVYFANNASSYNCSLFAVDPADGEERWRYTTNGRISSSPMIGADGTIFFGGDGAAYALHTDSGGLAEAPWPALGQNMSRTNKAQ
jgi:outer membrane protein assembly factor BamB